MRGGRIVPGHYYFSEDTWNMIEAIYDLPVYIKLGCHYEAYLEEYIEFLDLLEVFNAGEYEA